jgi:AmmeMemoRadiSam system protein A
VRVEILQAADSSASGGPEDGVVGYLSAAVLAPPQSGSEPAAQPGDAPLTEDDKKELLALARRTVDGFVSAGKMPDYQTDNPRLTAPRGAFVTLTKKGALRGCIGFIEAVAPLYEVVRRSAVYAASEDPRFPAVAVSELRDLAVEISVLTPPRPIADPGLVRVGKHGLIAESAGRRGLLLPQVAVENGWDREEFLSQTCVKAGLPPDAWKKGARISVFEAVVFH